MSKVNMSLLNSILLRDRICRMIRSGPVMAVVCSTNCMLPRSTMWNLFMMFFEYQSACLDSFPTVSLARRHWNYRP